MRALRLGSAVLAACALAHGPALAANHYPLTVVGGQEQTLPAGTGLQVNPATPANPSINIPCAAGVAPTSPQDGDEWCTSAGLFIRVGGLTIGPMASAGVTSFNTRTGSVTLASGDLSGAGGLLASNNLSDLGSASTARSNLGVATGANVEAWSANLDAVAALSTTGEFYYLSAANSWSPVTVGTGLTFTGGTLAASGGGGAGTVTSVTCGTGLTGGTFVTSGTCALANPSASTLGGIESTVGASHQWISSISTSGVPALTQPAFSDISGNIAVSQMNSGTSADSSHFWRGDGTWAAFSTIGTGANPFFIGTPDVRSGSGVPSNSLTDAEGFLLYLRTDISLLLSDVDDLSNEIPPSPAFVQSKASNSSTVTITSNTTAGDYLVAICGGGSGQTPSAGWTQASAITASSWATYTTVVEQYVSTGGTTGPFTPCAGTSTVSVVEVSGLNAASFTSNLVGVTYAQASATGTVVVNAPNTASNNNFAIAFGVSANGGGITAVASYSAGWSNTITAATTSEGTSAATEAFSTSGSTVSMTVTTSPNTWGITGGILVLQPTPAGPTAGWQQLSDFTIIKNAGSQITSEPRAFAEAACSTGTTCADDGNGNETLTASLSGTSSSIGGGALGLGLAPSTTVTVTGATTSEAVVVTPVRLIPATECSGRVTCPRPTRSL